MTIFTTTEAKTIRAGLNSLDAIEFVANDVRHAFKDALKLELGRFKDPTTKLYTIGRLADAFVSGFCISHSDAPNGKLSASDLAHHSTGFALAYLAGEKMRHEHNRYNHHLNSKTRDEYQGYFKGILDAMHAAAQAKNEGHARHMANGMARNQVGCIGSDA